VNEEHGIATLASSAVVALAGFVDPRVRVDWQATATLEADSEVEVLGAASLGASCAVVAVPNRLTTAVWEDYGGTRLFNIDEFGSVVVSYEVDMKTAAADKAALARLWNVTDAVAVADSELETDSTSMVRLRSLPLTLSGSKEYRAQIGSRAGATVTPTLASLIVKSPA